MSQHEYVMFGRVHPERCAVNVREFRTKAHMGTFKVEMALTISSSQIAVRLTSQEPIDVATIRNSVQAFTASLVDALGWVHGCGWRVELNVVASASAPPTFFGVSHPSVTVSATPGQDFVDLVRILNGDRGEKLLPLRRALADRREALLDVSDAPFHCFRAVEALTYYWDRNPNRGMPKLRAALLIDRPWIQKQLEIPAGAPRHGFVQQSISEQAWTNSLIASEKVLQRFIALIKSEGSHLDPRKYDWLRAGGTTDTGNE